jgi:hypothetical protein
VVALLLSQRELDRDSYRYVEYLVRECVNNVKALPDIQEKDECVELLQVFAC